MKMDVAYHFRVSRKSTIVTLILLLMVERLTCLEKRCPVYNDIDWQTRDQQCDPTKKYHCFENENSNVVAEGCYLVKECEQGAHPVVENKHIRCALCQEGYQPTPRLLSSSFEYSYCLTHSPCRPEFGESLCYGGTIKRDTACTCNATLGFSAKVEGENCSCFTTDGACSGCKFIGCPDGSSQKNGKGFCEPDESTVSSSSTTTPPKYVPDTSPLTTAPASSDDNGNDRGLIIGLTSAGLVIATIILIILLWRHGILEKLRTCNAPSDAESLKPLNGSSTPSNTAQGQDHSDSSTPMIPRNGIITPSDTAQGQDHSDSSKPMIPCNRIINVHALTANFSVADGTEVMVNYEQVIRGGDTLPQPSGTTQGGPSTPQRDPSASGTSHRGPSTPQRDPSVSGTSHRGPSTPQRDPSVSGTAHRGPSTPQRDPSVSGTAHRGPSTPQRDPSMSGSTHRGPSTPQRDPSMSGTTHGGPSIPQNARHPSVSSSHPPPESASSPQPSSPPESLPVPSAPPESLPDPSAPPESLPDPSAPPESLPDPSAPPESLPPSQLVEDQSEEAEENNTLLNTSRTRDEGDQSGVGDSDETLLKSFKPCGHGDQTGHDDFDETQRNEPISEWEAMDSVGTFPQRRTSGDGVDREAYTDVKPGASAHEPVAAQKRSVAPATCDDECDNALIRHGVA